MTENQSSKPDKNWDIQEVQEIKMVPITTEINEAFYNFLKEYLAFFGSHMTVEDLARQMIYDESRRLYTMLTEVVKDDKAYVGEIPLSKKFVEIAATIG